ncbi:MAG: acetyl/propionyl/methylcrotonyl-CoA carboxylase subunit alpha [Acidimicrobiales bacterium]
MFTSVLVANRGEIAVRVTRTLRALGIRSIAVYSDADAGARHVAEADDAIRLPGGYLDADSVLSAARRSGAEALHPGYGFLSENSSFAAACTGAGVVFVGPPAAAIEAMGDKINAKRTVAAAGVPVVPGRDEAGLSDAELAEAALDVGLPVLLKPSAGGGGKGMRRVDDPSRLAAEIAAARREAASAFGDDTLLVERFVSRPRHIEIQVFADTYGHVVHLGERECSLQRRHQKIIEEAPSPLLDAATRAAMGASAVEAARAVGYVGAGTVELIVSSNRPGEYFFMEMNTRLQVEHPVTEMVTGLDLVELQLRVAAGEALPFTQEQVALNGHAMEARVYAEDPARGFLPSAGRVLALVEPSGPGVRVDSGLSEGMVVGTSYDPMLSKVVAWGSDRGEALARLDRALAGTAVLGLTTNVGFLRRLLAHADVVAGRLDTELVERSGVTGADEVPSDVLVAAGLWAAAGLEPAGPVVDPWEVPGGWRVGEAEEAVFAARCAGRRVEIGVTGRAGEGASVRTGDSPPVAASGCVDGRELVLRSGGEVRRYLFAGDGRRLWIGAGGSAWTLEWEEASESAAALAAGDGGPVRSPMPGTVLAVHVAPGDQVSAGDSLVVVEAMKMEHSVTAPVDGTVSQVHVRVGEPVALDQPLAVVTAGAPAGPE